MFVQQFVQTSNKQFLKGWHNSTFVRDSNGEWRCSLTKGQWGRQRSPAWRHHVYMSGPLAFCYKPGPFYVWQEQIYGYCIGKSMLFVIFAHQYCLLCFRVILHLCIQCTLTYIKVWMILMDAFYFLWYLGLPILGVLWWYVKNLFILKDKGHWTYWI